MSAETLWSQAASPDQLMLAYTVGDDREVDAVLLRWDIIGSMGQVEALAGGGLISPRERGRMHQTLRAALRAAASGKLAIGPKHEDCHSAVEFWLTNRSRDLGQRIHAGRSRNDQVALDLRLYLRDRALVLHHNMIAAAQALLKFAARHQRVVWPGYTHQRIAMPSSAGAWAAGYAEQLLNSAELIVGIWPRLDRSPLGTAAGYGAPLPLDREAAMRSLGFRGLDQVVTSVQNSRGQLEAAVLFWCLDAAHALARISADVILYSSGEFGWLVLPDEFSTGSSIMPQKRNPDLFEISRARAAALQGDLAAVLAIRGSLPGGYHRDFQLLKAPLIRGIQNTEAMLELITAVIPALKVNRERATQALRPEIFATDEAMRRVRAGMPFRAAYREVAAELASSAAVSPTSTPQVLATRTATGGLGNLGLDKLRDRSSSMATWRRREERRIGRALDRLMKLGER